MKNYINGILYGIKISIKLMTRVRDIQKTINVLCIIQRELKENIYSDNVSIWEYIENKIYKY